MPLRSTKPYFDSTFTLELVFLSLILELCSFYLHVGSEELPETQLPSQLCQCRAPGVHPRCDSPERLQAAYRSVCRTWMRCSMAWMPTSSRYFCSEERQMING